MKRKNDEQLTHKYNQELAQRRNLFPGSSHRNSCMSKSSLSRDQVQEDSFAFVDKFENNGKKYREQMISKQNKNDRIAQMYLDNINLDSDLRAGDTKLNHSLAEKLKNNQL